MATVINQQRGTELILLLVRVNSRAVNAHKVSYQCSQDLEFIVGTGICHVRL